MSGISLEVIILLLLILLNGVFSMSEMAVVSARKNRLQEKADDGDRGARTAIKLAESPNRFLSTVQVGITLIGILTGAFGGATLAEPLAAWLNSYPALAPYGEGIAVALVVIVSTYLSLVVGELVPKRLALNNAEGIAMRVSPAMNALSVVTTPIVTLLSRSTDLVLRVLSAGPSGEPAVTSDDVSSMMEQGAQIGVVEKAEQDLGEHVFRLGDRSVTTVMTPRPEILFIDAGDAPDEICSRVIEGGYSRYPVFEETLDNIIGFLQVKDLFRVRCASAELNIRGLLLPALFVPDSMTALQVLERMRQTGVEVALVIDEYGGVQGLVSIHDILEALVGVVDLVNDSSDPDFVRREDGALLVDGRVLTDELKDLLDLDRLPDEEKGYYETLGGMLMTMLGRIPSAGDVYEYDGLRFEVMDMDGLRVDKVLVEAPSR